MHQEPTVVIRVVCSQTRYQGRKTGNSSSPVVKKHCDYLQKKSRIDADQIYHYKDVLLTEKLIVEYDF
ncbi:unnamed protein product [Parnassius apollo]|uniref:(apollo) hypothetical protein n=1 Tax=Parnassius apollo TaxID=110799 RepID=A0A8S3WEW3_PARAO|nr:unnamed protein product [Parnassius apollo]